MRCRRRRRKKGNEHICIRCFRLNAFLFVEITRAVNFVNLLFKWNWIWIKWILIMLVRWHTNKKNKINSFIRAPSHHYFAVSKCKLEYYFLFRFFVSILFTWKTPSWGKSPQFHFTSKTSYSLRWKTGSMRMENSFFFSIFTYLHY